MTRVVSGGGRVLSHTPPVRRRTTRGYAKSRQAYDARRRRHKLTDEGLAYKAIVQADPCSGCGALPGREANAADHIVPLDAGGENDWTNLTGLCRPCNAQKKNYDLLRWLHARQ